MALNWLRACGLSFLVIGASAGCTYAAPPGTTDSTLTIKVASPKRLPAGDIAAARTALGIPNDYKPWVVQLKNGTLLIVAFCFGGTTAQKGKPYSERAVFWRSTDGGRTWGPREERKEIHGREFSLNRLSDGTLIMPAYLLSNDDSNHDGYVYSLVYRSADNGRTWSASRIGPEGFPPRAETCPDWTVVEMPDPKQPGKTVATLGVSLEDAGARAPEFVRIWRSSDSGRTWNKTFKPDTDNWYDVDGFYSQTVTYRARSGKLLHPVRVDATGPHWRLPDMELKQKAGDNGDRTMLWESRDNGLTWHRHGQDGRFGTYGEMYPRFLRLKDNRLLLTFTVRSNSTDGYPLGLRALISYDDGETWDFDHDRLILSYKNEGASGGGFGNTIQLNDGKLISVHSYRGEDGKTHIEAVRWALPDQSSR